MAEKTHTHYHVVMFLYEKRNDAGIFQNSTQLDLRSNKDNLVDAVAECLAKTELIAKSKLLDSDGTIRLSYFVKDIVEHDHDQSQPEK